MKNEIISELYLSDDFNQAVSKIAPEHLREDLRQEVMLILMDQPEEKIIEMYNKGVLKYFTVKVMVNQSSSTGQFNKKFRTANRFEYNEEEDDDIDPREAAGKDKACYLVSVEQVLPTAQFADRLQKELSEDRAMEIIKNLYWYERTIVELYIKLGNYRAIEKETAIGDKPGIPWESCYSTVQKVIKKIRHELNTPNPLL